MKQKPHANHEAPIYSFQKWQIQPDHINRTDWVDLKNVAFFALVRPQRLSLHNRQWEAKVNHYHPTLGGYEGALIWEYNLTRLSQHHCKEDANACAGCLQMQLKWSSPAQSLQAHL